MQQSIAQSKKSAPAAETPGIQKKDVSAGLPDPVQLNAILPDAMQSAATEEEEIEAVPVNQERHEVWLNVYDIDEFVGRLNTSCLLDANLGAFHCGVQLLGDELFFAWGETDSTGIIRTEPRSHSVHVYRESISMGESPLSEREIRAVISHCVGAWPANSYHPITRNCVTFAEELIQRLQVPEPCPPWIRGAADAGNVPCLLPVADCSWSWVKWWCSTEPASEQQQA